MSNEATNDPHANESWEEFKRRFGLDAAPSPVRPVKSASLGPLRAVVTIIGKGRPRKDAPVHVPKGMKYCWLCWSVHPVDSFAIDRRNHDGKRRNCRSCDSAAAYGRKLKRQLKAASNLSMSA